MVKIWPFGLCTNSKSDKQLAEIQRKYNQLSDQVEHLEKEKSQLEQKAKKLQAEKDDLESRYSKAQSANNNNNLSVSLTGINNAGFKNTNFPNIRNSTDSVQFSMRTTDPISEERTTDESGFSSFKMKTDPENKGLQDGRGAYRQLNKQVTLYVHEKTELEQQTIFAAFQNNRILRNLDKIQLKKISESLKPISWVKNDIIINYGDTADGLFIITSGQIKIADPLKEKTKVDSAPVAIGELAIWYNHPRSATVTVLSEQVNGFKISVNEINTILTSIVKQRQSAKIRLLPSIFKKFNLTQKKIDYLCNICQLEEFHRGDSIITQGTYGTKMYIIDHGQVAVTEKKYASISDDRDGSVNSENYNTLKSIQSLGKISSRNVEPTERIIRIMSDINNETGKPATHEERVFGMIALFNESGRRTKSVICHSEYCTLFSLEKADLIQVLSANDLETLEMDRVHRDKRLRQKKEMSSSASNVVSPSLIVTPSSVDYNQRHSDQPENSLREQFTQKLSVKKSISNRIQKKFNVPEEVKKPIEALQYLTQLGKGQFGKVEMYAAILKNPPGKKLRLAVKTQLKTNDPEDYFYLKSELEIHSMMVNCGFIVKLYHNYEDSRHFYMYLEVCEFGNLFNVIRKTRYFPEEQTKFYLACIIEALDYCHRIGIAYRDLKLENLVLNKHRYLKLTDFGISKKMNKDHAVFTTFCGTAAYMAPEVISKRGHTNLVDHWTCGIILYEMMTGRPPFGDNPSINHHRDIKKIFRDRKPNQLTHRDKGRVIKLIKSFLKFAPHERIGAISWDQVRSDLWFEGFRWDSLKYQRLPAPELPSAIMNSVSLMINSAM